MLMYVMWIKFIFNPMLGKCCGAFLIESGLVFVLGVIHEHHNTGYRYILTEFD